MEIRVHQLTKTYDTQTVLNVADLRISRGAICGIIGPNGAGKSTLIKLIGGLEEATSGQLLYDGASFSPEIYRQVTVVFQKPYLLNRTVYQNIAYPLAVRGLKKAEIAERVDSLLERMELVKLRDQHALTLSGGEAQKVALARALVFQPSLLILDEPTANIDPASMAFMETMIADANQRAGMTVILVTHNLQQARRLCTQVAFMHKGQGLEAGEPEELIFRPHHPVVQNFMETEIIFSSAMS